MAHKGQWTDRIEQMYVHICVYVCVCVCMYMCVCVFVCAHVAWVCEHSKTSYLIKWTWIAVYFTVNIMYLCLSSPFLQNSFAVMCLSFCMHVCIILVKFIASYMNKSH